MFCLIRHFLCSISIPDKQLHSLSDGIMLYWMLEQLIWCFLLPYPCKFKWAGNFILCSSSSYCSLNVYQSYVRSYPNVPDQTFHVYSWNLKSWVLFYDQMELASRTSFSIWTKHCQWGSYILNGKPCGYHSDVMFYKLDTSVQPFKGVCRIHCLYLVVLHSEKFFIWHACSVQLKKLDT